MAEPSQASSTSAHQYILHEARNTTIGHAMFNNVGGNFNQNYYAISSNPLWEAIADVGASHNSEIQVERGRCLPGTRESVLKIIREWKRSGSGSSPVCWLSGAAGVGKSAIALTFAEECEDEGLVASFFFFRSDPKRNNPSSLVLSIAHGLVVTRPHLGPLVNQQITADPRILKATLENQYKKLVLRNLDHPSPSPAEASPDLVIIDGLDECSDPNTQQRVLSIIFSAAQQSLHSPLRFLICSRPEAWIRDVFVSSAYCSLTKHIKLDDSFRSWYDVELYFNQQFRAICSDPRYSQVEFPNPWPSSRVVELLVRIANGQFIYASTVIKFIMTEYTHPIEQLNIILGDRSTGNSDLSTQRPFHELDQLYHTVLCANPDPNKHLVPILAASLLLPNNDISRSPAFIERLLGFPTGTVTLTLRAMHSVVNVNGRLDNMRIYHTSFADFLFDQARSKEFFIDENYQLDFLAQRWLRALQTSKSSAEQETDSELWKHWGDVCSLVDNPTRELLLQLDGLHLNALITGTLRFLQFDGFSAMRCLFRHFRTIACWLYGRADGTVPPTLLDRFETVLKGFAIPASMVTATEIATYNGIASEIATWTVKPEREHLLQTPEQASMTMQPISELPKSVLLDLLSSAAFSQCSSSRKAWQVAMGAGADADGHYHVDIQYHYPKVMEALVKQFNKRDIDDPEMEGIIWDLLHPWLITSCHPQLQVLSIYRAALMAAERLRRHYSGRRAPRYMTPNHESTVNSKRPQDKILLWLDSFPPVYATEAARIKEIIDDSRMSWSFDRIQFSGI